MTPGMGRMRHRIPGENPMHRVLVLGAGKIGALISGLLADAGRSGSIAAQVHCDEH